MPFDIGQLLSTIFSQALGGGGAAQGVRPSNGMAPQFGGGLFGGAFQNTHGGTNAFSSANPYISQVASVANQAGTRSGLPSLDANTQNALNTIQNNQMAQLSRTFADQNQSLVSKLYGGNIEHSSFANDLASRLAERQGYVADQAASDAANRFLGQQNTSADRSLQGLGMQQQGLGQAAGLTNEQNQMQFQQQQQQLQMLVSLLPTLLQAHQQVGGGGPQPHAQEDFAHSATYGSQPQQPSQQWLGAQQGGAHTDSLLQAFNGSNLSPDMQQFQYLMAMLRRMGVGNQNVTGGYDPLGYAESQARSFAATQPNLTALGGR